MLDVTQKTLKRWEERGLVRFARNRRRHRILDADTFARLKVWVERHRDRRGVILDGLPTVSSDPTNPEVHPAQPGSPAGQQGPGQPSLACASVEHAEQKKQWAWLQGAQDRLAAELHSLAGRYDARLTHVDFREARELLERRLRALPTGCNTRRAIEATIRTLARVIERDIAEEEDGDTKSDDESDDDFS